MRIAVHHAVVLLLGVGVALAATAAAQPAPRVPRVGLLAERSSSDPTVTAFVDALRALGHVDGRSIVLDVRYGEGNVDRYPALVAELIRSGIDVLVVGGSVAAGAARAATTTIPIIFTSVGDPVATGLVANLARPGGNVTGVSNVVPELSGKQLELLKLAAPATTRVAVLHNPLNSGPSLDVTRRAARVLNVTLLPLAIHSAGDLAAAFDAAARGRADAVLALSDPVMGNATLEVAKRALAQRLPAIYTRAEFADNGGLLAYGPDFAENYRRAATYVDRILRGARPGDLAVEQPTTFELVVNARTARTLGLALPPSLLQRAARVID